MTPDAPEPAAREARRILNGRWRRVTPAAASATPYPDEIEFVPNGLYRGKRGEGGSDFTIWDVGRAEVLSANRIRLSTANDAEIVYDVVLSGDELRFQGVEGAPLAYRRVT